MEPGKIALMKSKTYLSFCEIKIRIATVCGLIETLKHPSPSRNPVNQAVSVDNDFGPKYVILILCFLLIYLISSNN